MEGKISFLNIDKIKPEKKVKKIEPVVKYERDELGRIIEIAYEDKENKNLGNVERFKYDKFGRIIKKIYEDKETFQTKSFKYKGDYDKNVIKTIEVSINKKDGEKISETISCEYKYDKNGNIIQKIDYFNNKKEKQENYVYDDKNNVIKKITKDAKTGIERISTYSYEYDKENNKKISMTEYDGKIKKYFKKYDEKGNIAQFIEYDGSKENKEIKITTYSYAGDNLKEINFVDYIDNSNNFEEELW